MRVAGGLAQGAAPARRALTHVRSPARLARVALRAGRAAALVAARQVAALRVHSACSRRLALVHVHALSEGSLAAGTQIGPKRIQAY